MKRAFVFAEQFENIDINMIYVTVAFHDLAHHIDKANHETLSNKLFYDNEKMKDFFTDDQSWIIKKAIEDHRASLKYEPRSDYGKIIFSADRNTDILSILRRTHTYTTKHYPKLDLNGIITRAYEHIGEKYGDFGYAKMWLIDEEFDHFKDEVKELLKDKNIFKVKYMETKWLFLLMRLTIQKTVLKQKKSEEEQ